MLKQVVLLMTTIKHVKMYFTKKTNAEYSVTGMDWKGNKENYLKTSRENVLVEKKWRFSHPLNSVETEKKRVSSRTMGKTNRPRPSSKNLHFQNEAKWTTFLVKNELYLHKNEKSSPYQRLNT